MTDSDISPKSRGVALALATLTGTFGGHRFYVGKIGTGICQLLTIGGLGIWTLYDWILVVAGSFRDIDGKRVANWAEESIEPKTQLSGERMELLLDELDALRSEMEDLSERVDFTERVLSQVRDRAVIPPASTPL